MALLCFVHLSDFCPCVCQVCSGAGWLATTGSSGEEGIWEGRHLLFYSLCVTSVFENDFKGQWETRCLHVYLTWCEVCIHKGESEGVCMVLPTPLEMLGRPAGLFLDQWQRVNGCRCVAKEGSEIPTNPGRSFPNLPSPACQSAVLFVSEHVFSVPSFNAPCFTLTSPSTQPSLIPIILSLILSLSLEDFLPQLLSGHYFLSAQSFLVHLQRSSCLFFHSASLNTIFATKRRVC